MMEDPSMKTRTNISLSPDTMAKLKELAAEQHLSVSQWITNQVWTEAKKEELAAQLTAEMILQKAAEISSK